MKLPLKRIQSAPRYTRRSVFIAVTLICASGLFGLQIWLSGEIATAGQQINEYEQRKAELTNEHARLQEQYNALSALDSIQKKAVEMGFVRVSPESLHYVNTLDSFASLFQQ